MNQYPHSLYISTQHCKIIVYDAEQGGHVHPECSDCQFKIKSATTPIKDKVSSIVGPIIADVDKIPAEMVN